MAAACSKKSPIKRTALCDFKNKVTVFFQGSSETQVFFSWPYVEPPSKSATASNILSSDDDAIEIETMKLFKNKLTTGHLILQCIEILQPQYRWFHLNKTHIHMNKSCTCFFSVFFSNCLTLKKISKMPHNFSQFKPGAFSQNIWKRP